MRLKKDSSVSITSDLSPLNAYIVPDRHQLHSEDILLQFRGRVFSKIDLRKTSTVLSAKSRPLTATITPLGLMVYNRLPMGLRDAAAVLQCCVSSTLANCSIACHTLMTSLCTARLELSTTAPSAVLDALATK